MRSTFLDFALSYLLIYVEVVRKGSPLKALKLRGTDGAFYHRSKIHIFVFKQQFFMSSGRFTALSNVWLRKGYFFFRAHITIFFFIN